MPVALEVVIEPRHIEGENTRTLDAIELFGQLIKGSGRRIAGWLLKIVQW